MVKPYRKIRKNRLPQPSLDNIVVRSVYEKNSQKMCIHPNGMNPLGKALKFINLSTDQISRLNSLQNSSYNHLKLIQNLNPKISCDPCFYKIRKTYPTVSKNYDSTHSRKLRPYRTRSCQETIKTTTLWLRYRSYKSRYAICPDSDLYRNHDFHNFNCILSIKINTQIIHKTLVLIS